MIYASIVVFGLVALLIYLVVDAKETDRLAKRRMWWNQVEDAVPPLEETQTGY